jgi:carboxypeptidase Q
MPDSPSRNILIDLVGTDKPDEYVLLSGHGDSWDIAEGAMDDGGGFMVSWEAVRVMQKLGLRPKRTIRAVVWVNEENGEGGIMSLLCHCHSVLCTVLLVTNLLMVCSAVERV